MEHNSLHRVKKLDTNLIWNQLKYKCRIIPKQFFLVVPELCKAMQICQQFFNGRLKPLSGSEFPWVRKAYLFYFPGWFLKPTVRSVSQGQLTLKLLEIASSVQNLATFWEVIYSQHDVFCQVGAQGSRSYRMCQEQIGIHGFQKTKTFWEQF